MSQFNIRNIREISNAPLEKFTNTLAKRISQSITNSETAKLENKEDIYSAAQDVDSVIKYHSLVSTNTFDLTTEYYSPSEPDLDKLTLWLQGRNMGNELTDLSGFNNEITMRGDPLLIDGSPFDYGMHTGGVKSRALRFNRPTSEQQNSEGIRVDDDDRLQISGTTIGISYFIRVRLHSLAAEGGHDVVLFEEVSGTGWVGAPVNGVMLVVTPTGRLYFTRRRSSVTTEKMTDAGTIATDTVYDIWITNNQGTGEIKIYVNNVDKTLSNGSTGYAWRVSPGNVVMDFSIMHDGGTSAVGHAYADLYDFRVYREKVISAAEVGYHYTNKWTIADIPFGQVMISNYFLSFSPDLAGYDPIGYDSTGYDTVGI